MSNKFKKIQKSEGFLFEKLEVYQRAVDFANKIHELTKRRMETLTQIFRVKIKVRAHH